MFFTASSTTILRIRDFAKRAFNVQHVKRSWIEKKGTETIIVGHYADFFVARIGGDEFVVMLSELEVDKDVATKQALTVAEKILATLGEPYKLSLPDSNGAGYITHHCTASIGLAMFINHEASQDELLKWADIAMYQAKKAGRNQVRLYEGVV